MGTKEIIKVIENNPTVVATSTKDGKVNTTLVTGIKVKDGRLNLTDTSNEFKKLVNNVLENDEFSLICLNPEKKGYKIQGFANYLTEGEEFEFVKNLEQNLDKEVRGVVVFTPMDTEEI